MEYATLGKTDIVISNITHGCMELGGGPWEVKTREHNINLLKTAFEMGVSVFDTAEIYGDGNSERIVGEALKNVRHQCVIATKVAHKNLRYKDVKTACEGSLKNLGMDYVDLLYVHWPNHDVPIEETMTAFNELKREGKIRAIGVSNFNLEQIKAAEKYATVDALQPEYNLLERTIENGLLDYCADNKISVLSYNSIAKGILSGVFHFKGLTLAPDDFRNQKPLFSAFNMKAEKPLLDIIRDVAENHNATMAQVSTAWILTQRGMSSAIIGTQNLKHFKDNINAVNIKLTADEIKVIDEVSRAVIANLK